METEKKKLGPGGWFIIAALVAMLAASVIYAIDIWTSMDVAMSGLGWFFLILGVLVSLALGGGLMALVFYSSRHDYDR